MKNVMNKTMMLGLMITMAAPAFAGTTAKEGMEKIKTNFSNSKTNLGEYQRNLKTVDKNIGEIQKAKTQVDEQRKAVGLQVEENKKSLVKVTSQEKEIQTLIADEKTKKASEEKKLQELQAMVLKLQENIGKRDANLADYDLQMNALQEEKRVWTSRGDQIKQQGDLVNQRTSALTKNENDWKNKKKGYEGEVGRWSKEVDRQQKLNDNYSSLAEVRD